MAVATIGYVVELRSTKTCMWCIVGTVGNLIITQHHGMLLECLSIRLSIVGSLGNESGMPVKHG